VLNNCINGDAEDSISYNNSLLGLNRNKIGIITGDGNWSYRKLIECNRRKIVKKKKRKEKKKGKFLEDEKDNLLKDIKEKEYKNDNKIFLDCENTS
jgi:hypothetical protein